MASFIRGIVQASISATIIVLVGIAASAAADVARVKELLKSDDYVVAWGTAPVFDSEAELEIGAGNGHGGTFRAIRFLPSENGVDILEITHEDRTPYRSTWPPDVAPVEVRRARMSMDVYRALLADLATVSSARLSSTADPLSSTLSTDNFWVAARLTSKDKTHFDFDWCDYPGNQQSAKSAKAEAAVTLCREAMKKLKFEVITPTTEDRRWASTRFNRDWKKYRGSDRYWWVRERAIITIGVVGDRSVYPTLLEILSTPTADKDSNSHCVYYAVNATVRLTKTEVRTKPVEELNLKEIAPKAIALLEEQAGK